MARKISMRQAINEALDQEMARDPNVIVMGEDIVGGEFAPFVAQPPRSSPVKTSIVTFLGVEPMNNLQSFVSVPRASREERQAP